MHHFRTWSMRKAFANHFVRLNSIRGGWTSIIPQHAREREHSPQPERYEIANTSGRIYQTAEYMQELGLRYGFLSNYNETIFLRQIEVSADNELWTTATDPKMSSGASNTAA
ncbi:hypothetical protein PHISP_03689 [Aspergillus sp. HF37]|nr:hypothetical protein PHISP_03689 [Aspergillus sp. HF37]